MKTVLLISIVFGSSLCFAYSDYDAREESSKEANDARWHAIYNQRSREIESEIYGLFAKMAASHGGVTNQQATVGVAGSTYMEMGELSFNTGDGLACKSQWNGYDGVVCKGPDDTRCPKVTLHTSCYDGTNQLFYMSPNGKLEKSRY